MVTQTIVDVAAFCCGLGKSSRKIQERNLIVKWMRRQTSTEAWRLAKLIEIGIHKETS